MKSSLETSSSERILTVPNVVTAIRFALVPVFVGFYLAGRPDRALACFGIAAFSDGLDGLLARLLNQRSRLGALLDPVADKVLVFSALLTLVSRGRLPKWLLYLIIARDLYMTAVALAVRLRGWEVQVAPSRVGKYATFSLSLLVALCLTSDAGLASAWLEPYVPAIGLIAALAVALSAAQYVRRFSYLFGRAPQGFVPP